MNLALPPFYTWFVGKWQNSLSQEVIQSHDAYHASLERSFPKDAFFRVLLTKLILSAKEHSNKVGFFSQIKRPVCSISGMCRIFHVMHVQGRIFGVIG